MLQRHQLCVKVLVAALVISCLIGLGCSCSARDTVDGGLGDVRVLAIGEIIEVDPDREILSLRILDNMTHTKSGDVVVVDYSDAEVRYGCDVEFEEGSILAVESLGLPLKNPMAATRIMCRDCGFKHMVGVEAPSIGDPWGISAEENAS